MEWVSVKDKLPKEGSWYLTFSVNFPVILFLDGFYNGEPIWLEHGDYDYPVTHWMPLPEPPTNNRG